MDVSTFPPSDSPLLYLAIGTAAEEHAILLANSVEWRGTLSLEAFLRREAHLRETDLCKDGGLTPWFLVFDTPSSPSGRQAICACESIKKRAFVKRAGGEGVEEVVAQGVASVFTPVELRGRGYAARMMDEMARKMRSWQEEREGEGVAFSALWSDIGRTFYARKGWRACASGHVALPAVRECRDGGEGVRAVQKEELDELCKRDEELLKARLGKWEGRGTAVALVPDARTLRWHHAREDFVTKELKHEDEHPHFGDGGRGAMVEVEGGRGRVWCYWTRVWSDPHEEAPSTLHILRLVVEDDEFHDFVPASEEGIKKVQDSPVVKAIAKVLTKAQVVAGQSGMDEVTLWNPASAILAAARLIDPKSAVVHREKESITSLLWYGEGKPEDVDWVCNEKYGWC